MYTLLLCLFALPAQGEFTVKSKTMLHSADVQKAVRAMVTEPSGRGAHQVRISWKTRKGRAASTVTTLSMMSHRFTSDEVPRQRVLELATDRILVLGVDAAGSIKFWSVMPNPRMQRAEFPGPDGRLSGQTIERPEADFLVDLPDDPAIREVRVYLPSPRDGAYDLRLMGTVALPRRTR